MKHGQIVEYGSFPSSELSKRTTLETRKNGRNTFELCHHAVGFECAGSMARFQGHEVWSVRFEQGGAEHGRRFLTLEEAQALFNKWAPLEVAA